MPRRLLLARAAGVGDDHGHIAEVRPVAHRGLYADLRGDAADGERHQPQVAHDHTEESALEGAHGDLVGVAVPPLSRPDPRYLPAVESLSDYEAARLFVDRAGAVKPGFELTESNATAVAQVCHRLDGYRSPWSSRPQGREHSPWSRSRSA